MPGTIASLWQQVHQAFAGVDCILHAGDLHVSDVIDELEQIAPTFVSEGNGDIDVVHHRLRQTWIGEFAGRQVAMVHKFPTPRRADENKLNKKVGQFFAGANPDVVIYGHTHLAEVHEVAGRLYINPGSATLPNNQSTRLGTIGRLHVTSESISLQLLQLTETGVEPLYAPVVLGPALGPA